MDTAERVRKNAQYYDHHAQHVEDRSNARDFSRAFEAFLARITSAGTILDIGSGTGAHLQVFAERGFEALGIEPSQKMRALAERAGVDSVDGSFEAMPANLPTVAGFWCAASLLHVPKEHVPDVLKKLHALLPLQGPLYLTVRLGRTCKWDSYDDGGSELERFIQLFEEDLLAAALADAGFRIEEQWLETSYWGRPCQWISIVAVKTEGL